MRIIYTNHKLDFRKIQRPNDTQLAYDKFLIDVKLKNQTVEEFVLDRYFLPYSKIAIIKNDYPYKLPDGYTHMVIWTKNTLTKNRLNLILDLTKIELIWENHHINKSAPGLIHYHFIIKDEFLKT